MHITRKFRFNYFSENLAPLNLIFLVFKGKGIDVHLCREFLADGYLRVMLFIKLFYAFNAYLKLPFITCIIKCQVIGEHGVCELAHFFFHFSVDEIPVLIM